MPLLVWVLLESPLALGTVLGLLCFGLLVHWRRGGTPRPLLIALAAAAVLLVVQAVVVTPREHAARVLRPIEFGLLQSDIRPLAAALAPGFSADGMDAEAFVQRAREALRRMAVTRLMRLRLQIEDSTPQGFSAVVRYLADIRIEGQGGAVDSTWKIHFATGGGACRIRAIEPQRFQGLEIRSWRELLD